MAIQEKIFVDAKYGFEKNSSGDTSPVYNESSINQALMTLFLTAKGERFFNPSYGTNIKNLLFEPFDTTTANQIAIEIEDAVNFYEGARIELINVNITVDFDNGTYRINVEYRIKSTTETGSLNLIIPKG